MTAKPPTPQGISALLRKAGFERAVLTRNDRHHKEHTAGFHVRKYPGAVLVTWWAESVPPSLRTTDAVQAERAEGRRIRAEYAEVIRAAGWSVDVRDSLEHLIVTAAGE